MVKSILILNGSIQGAYGNSHKLLSRLVDEIKKLNTTINFTLLNLVEISENPNLSRKQKEDKIAEAFQNHQACIFATGTYWDSWGSPMQSLLEMMTPLEGSPAVLGKPASVIVTMHSVGGKEVVSRLQGVLATMGFLIPPMAHLAYSLQDQLLTSEPSKVSDFAEDFWNLEDLQIIAHNFLEAGKNKAEFLSWVVDKKEARRIWFR